MNKIIDGLSESQRMGLLGELLDDLNPDERDMIHERLLAVESGKNDAEIARKIAEKRNNPNGGTSGVVGKKLI